MTSPSTAIDLSGEWSLRSASNGEHHACMQVPGDVHSALQRAGIIDDPYVGANELETRWVADHDWHLFKDFMLSEEQAGGSWYLDLDFVDTVATISVNGTEVLQADNCFKRYRPDVSRWLRAGDNRIEVVLHSPVNAGKAVYESLPFEVPWHETNCPIPYGNMLRKPQCHFGWDWNIALAPSGLYGAVALRKLVDARIEHVNIRQVHKDDGSVELEVRASLFAIDPAIVPVHFELDGERVRLDCGINAGMTEIGHVFEIDKPRLWWPAGSGDQALYLLKVELPGETVTRQVGLRTIELVTEKDAAGNRFAFRVNGVEIFCRGANWIPADALFSRTSREKTEDLLRSAVEANMNMLRIWGGGFYEHDWFYDLCDRLGLMIWQDFMFACNLYPSTPAFLDNVAGEVDYQVRRLSHHASIALWCGDNELVGALGWFDASRKDRDRYLVSYDRLNRTIETAMRAADPDALWWPSSPSCGYMNFGDAWHADGSGDMHFWSVWHENKSFDHYRDVKPRFCSEFGFQSYTSMQVVRQFADGRDLNIASPVMEIHQKNPGGNERIAGTMFRYFRFPKDFENFVYLSQIQQALAIKTAVNYWRSLKPHCMGTIFWQLNDTWPVASWASLDYGGNWKALHYFAKRFFQPVAVAAIPSGDGQAVTFSGVNDTSQPVDVTLQLDLVGMDGARQSFRKVSGQVNPDAACTICSVEQNQIPPGAMLIWRFEASNGMQDEGHFIAGTYKALELPASALKSTVTKRADGGFDVTVASPSLSLFVMVESDVEGRFSDNGFDLCAGERRTIAFHPRQESQAWPVFVLRDLHSCHSVD